MAHLFPNIHCVETIRPELTVHFLLKTLTEMIDLSLSDISDDDIIKEHTAVGIRPKVKFKVRHVKRQEKNNDKSSQANATLTEQEENEEVRGGNALNRNMNSTEKYEEEDDVLSDSNEINSERMLSSFAPKGRKIQKLFDISSSDDESCITDKEKYFQKYGHYNEEPNGESRMNHDIATDEIIVDAPDEEPGILSNSLLISRSDDVLRNKEIAEALFSDLDDIDLSDAESYKSYPDSFEVGLGKDKLKVFYRNLSFQQTLSKIESKITYLQKLKEKTESESLHLDTEHQRILSKQQETIAKAFERP